MILWVNQDPSWFSISLRIAPANVIEGGIGQHQQVHIRIRKDSQDDFDQRVSRRLGSSRLKVEDPLANQPRTLLLIGSVVEDPRCSQSPGYFHNGMQDSQLQGNSVAPQLERVIHVL